MPRQDCPLIDAKKASLTYSFAFLLSVILAIVGLCLMYVFSLKPHVALFIIGLFIFLEYVAYIYLYDAYPELMYRKKINSAAKTDGESKIYKVPDEAVYAES